MKYFWHGSLSLKWARGSFFLLSFQFINHIAFLSSVTMSANLSWVLLGIAYILGASALLVSVFWLYRISSWRWLTLSSSSLSHLPEVKYEDENYSAERYNRHMKPLIHEGYMKVWKWNIAESRSNVVYSTSNMGKRLRRGICMKNSYKWSFRKSI